MEIRPRTRGLHQSLGRIRLRKGLYCGRICWFAVRCDHRGNHRFRDGWEHRTDHRTGLGHDDVLFVSRRYEEMIWLDLLVLSIASHQAVVVWLLPGGPLEELRLWLEAYFTGRVAALLTTPNRQSLCWQLRFWWRSKLLKLVSCLVCLHHWWPALLILSGYLPSLWLPDPWATILRLPSWSLAATWLGLRLQELFHDAEDGNFS